MQFNLICINTFGDCGPTLFKCCENLLCGSFFVNDNENSKNVIKFTQTTNHHQLEKSQSM